MAYPGQWEWPEEKEGTDPVLVPGVTAQPRPHARSVLAGGTSSSLPVSPAGAAGGRAADLAAVLLDRPGTLLHARPPSFRDAQRRHHECAGHHAGRTLYAGRLAYGYLHMALVKAPLNYAEWATDSPLRLLIHAIVGALVFAGLLLGGYL